jgi:predicted transcriptional regulator
MALIKETAKDRVLKIVHGQPDDSAFDEILQELALARMIERGLADSESNRTISHEEIGQRISSWAK